MAKVLIIDDDEMVLSTIADVIQSLGHVVRTAADGREGLALFAEEPFDCVVTDLQMPDIDGLTVLQRVKAHSPTTGVLVVTGNSTTQSLVTSVNLGVDGYVHKPFKLAEMDAELNRILRRRKERSPAGVSSGQAPRPVVARLALGIGVAAVLYVLLR